MSRNSFRLWLLGSAVLALVAGPFLARGDQQVRQRQQRHLEKIGQMSPSDRDRLDRNWAAYEQMSEIEKGTLSTFHWQIEQDRQTEGGELGQILEDYHAWLNTIEPYQRDQLNRTEDPKKRIELMTSVVRRQQERSAERSVPRRLSGASGRGRNFTFWLRGVPVLNSEDLARVMEAMRELTPSRLTEPQKRDLDHLVGVARYVQLLRFLKDNDLNSQPFFLAVPSEFDRIARRFATYVEDSRAREYMTDPRPFPSPERRFASILFKSIVTEAFIDGRRQGRAPSDRDLAEYFVTLPPEEQDELLTLEAADFHTDLANRFRYDLSDLFEVFGNPFQPGDEDRYRRDRDRRSNEPEPMRDGPGGPPQRPDPRISPGRPFPNGNRPPGPGFDFPPERGPGPPLEFRPEKPPERPQEPPPRREREESRSGG